MVYMAFSEIELSVVFLIGLIIFYIGHKKAKGSVKILGGLIAIASLILIAITLFMEGVAA